MGWQPPEVILSETHMKKKPSQKTLKVDIFSLGCVFYYILSLGEHPFGKRYEREKNIMSQKYSLNSLEMSLVQERIKEAQYMIE